jgi:hypothetical protein
MMLMRIADAQLAASRSWHMQLGRCVLVALALAFVAFETLHRVHEDGLTLLWSGFALIAVYMAEQTWHAWRQLQFSRELDDALTGSEFRQAKAKEELHTSLSALLLLVGLNVLISWSLRGIVFSQFRWTLFVLLSILAAQVFRTWLELPRVSA